MKDFLRLELPVLPLRNTVVLPHTTTGVDVGRLKSKRAVEEALSADRLLFLVTQKDPEVDDPARRTFTPWAPWPWSSRPCACRTAPSR